MLFPTIDFAVFFLFVLGTSLVATKLGNTPNKLVLVAASLIFYSFWSVAFAGLMVGVAVMITFVGQTNRLVPSRRLRITLVTLAIVAVLALLGYFKYYNFVLSLLLNTQMFAFVGDHLSFMEAVTPVAISFFTFHAISYVVDTYKKPELASRSPLDVLLYISFFPHLVAGPIVRAATFMPQLAHAPVRTAMPYSEAFLLILSGLWKKMIAANYLAVMVVDPVFTAPAAYGSFDLTLAAIAYTFQIYFDFSAYTSIAIGIAGILGYRFPENFNQPYRSRSMREFWTRWHITLSTWLRDYLYIPLGGSRYGVFNTIKNLMITMVLGGLWHGANLTFLVWGALHGLALVGNHLWNHAGVLRTVRKRTWYMVAAWALTFVFTVITWIVFRSPDLASAGQYFSGLADFSIPSTGLAAPLVIGLIALGFIGQFIPGTMRRTATVWLSHRSLTAQVALLTLALVGLLMLAPSDAAPFIYFQF